jgi:ParB family chromosome partitioning protein
MNKKSLTPLQAMTQSSYSTDSNFVDFCTDKIIEISPKLLQNWKYSDRPAFELGDIEDLATDLKTTGQLQPCIVRATENSSEFPYELIVGERRWRASLIANINLKVIVKKINDQEAALLQISENQNRKNLSDYAKGMNYHNLVTSNILTQGELAQKLGKSKQYVSSLLSYARIPQMIRDAIGDMSKVSYRTAEEICRLSNKGQEYIDLILEVSDKLRSGKFGQDNLNRYVNASSRSPKMEKTKFYSRSGNLLFTIKEQNKEICSITFSTFASSKIKNTDSFIGELTSVVEKNLN